MRRVPATLRRVSALLPLLLLVASPAAAQSAEEVLNTALERYEEQIGGVDSYTVTQEVMGFTTTNRFVKKEIDGHPVFVAAESAGDTATGLPEGWGNPYRMVPELAARAELVGTATTDGQESWVIEISDLEGLDFRGMTPSGVEGEFDPERLTFHVDRDELLFRRLGVKGQMTRGDGSARPIELDAAFRDYRTIEGMPHPFEIQVNVQGMSDAVSDEEMARAREQLEELRGRMEEMPEQQRQMMERMMGPQMEQLEKMVTSGTMDVTVQVKEVRVNEGS